MAETHGRGWETGRCWTCAMLLFLALHCPSSSATECDDQEDLGPDHICCGGRVFYKDMDRQCCDLVGYPKGEQAYVLRSRCQNGQATSAFEECGVDQVPFDTRHYRCCTGSWESTVVSRSTFCCNGEGLGAGEMCCETDSQGSVAINKTHSLHTECCDPGDLGNIRTERHRIPTFNHDTEFCSEGRVQSMSGQEEEESLSSSAELLEASSSQSSSSRTEQSSRIRSTNNAKNKRGSRFKSSSSLPPEEACLVGKKKRKGGERLQCCGPIPFRPSQETCCEDVVRALPSSTSVCCYDEAFLQGDPANPCRASTCGGRPLDLNSQLCCQKKVFNITSPSQFCCGPIPVDPESHHCCGGMAVLKKQWSCCQNTMPYIRALMTCHRDPGTVTLRQKRLKRQSIPRKFCDFHLDTWGERWRALIDPKMLKIQGRVESCGIRVRGDKLTVPMSPAVAVVGGEAVSSCLKSQGLKLVIALPKKASCRFSKSKLKKLKAYLRGRTLEVFVKATGKLRCQRGWGVISLGENEVALVLRSRKMDSLLQDASLSIS